MFGKFEDICIQGIATCVPDNVVDNLIYAEQLGEKRVKKHIRFTGVEKKHKLKQGQKASDLAIHAAQKVMSYLDWKKDDICVLVYVTQSPDYEKPATSFVIQKELDITKDAMVFDVNLGCSGFVAGVQIVAGLLNQQGAKGLLLLGDGYYGEERESKVDELLFGEAGCAIAIEKTANSELKYYQKSDGRRFDAIYKPRNGRTKMDGNAVFAFTINDVADSVKESLSIFGLEEKDIDYYIFHQGQKMILQNLIEICGIEYEKVLFSIEEYGNTGGMSIPVTLCANCEKLQEIKKNSIRLYMCGFGVGLAWGSIYTKINPKGILPIVTL